MTTGRPTRRAALAMIAPALVARAARAQPGYPSRPVRIVVPFPAGGGADLVARSVAEGLAAAMGQGFVVDNRPGGSGNIGTELVARAPADGYTLLLIGPNHVINPFLFGRVPFDPVADFRPVSLLTSASYVLVAGPALPEGGFKALVARARAEPGRVSYGSAGNGSAGHLGMELIKQSLGLDMVHVPYRGSSAMLTDLMGGRIVAGFDNILSAAPHIAAGRLRALAVSGRARAPALPEVPTIAESGLPGFDVTVWQGLLAPAGTDGAIIETLRDAVRAALLLPTLEARLASLGVEAIGSDPDGFGRFIAAELERWSEVVRRSGAKAD
ncbi:Bug family tripartite tricarboxylate transporter substrate binding protein [Roseomonas populi]|uniref:Bug family tripartite tricarboxylate transporter substrate binding protein n=1 Tax=Roseomonas populi TaxID=3121582 RepID=UPI00214F5FAB|nr:tripartite tricarboxylate transporter substrate binding protein [Roseomonas pecuniae]